MGEKQVKAYFENDYVTLYQGNCLDYADVIVGADILITDPPYGMSYVSNSSLNGPSKEIAGDNDVNLRNKIIDLWRGRGEKPALIFGTWRVERPIGTKQLIIWDKGDSPGMGDLTMPWGPSHEEIYVLGKGWQGKRRPNVYRVPTLAPSSKERPNHPTPKPVPLMEQLIDYAPEGVIVDPFAGSGATLVAAQNMNRKVIGIEIDEQYCELIASRLLQQSLFG
jgi:site-specific DNA-methyltransferase (adenine-specific)